MTTEITPERLAACRMQVAMLHSALQGTLPSIKRDLAQPHLDVLLVAQAALEFNEPRGIDIIETARALVAAARTGQYPEALALGDRLERLVQEVDAS